VRGATAIVLAVALAGCGTGGHDAAPGPATTTAPSSRVAPAGAPYSFAAPAGFESGSFPVEHLKAGSHPDFTSFLQAAAAGDTTTVAVLAMHAGEQVPGDPADLGPRVWRELAPNAAAEPPVTPLPLGSADGFEMVADTATAGATGRTVYRGAAIGRWVVVLICTAVGPGAGEAIAATCDTVAHTVQLRDAPAPPATDGPVAEDAAPYTFDVPAGFAAADPAVIREQLGGTPASLVVHSWENRVLVFSSDAGHRLAQIDAPSFCRVVAKILPRSTTQPGPGHTIGGLPGVRCDATSFTDPAGRAIPDLAVAAYGVVHDTYLSVVLCYSTAAQRAESAKGCDAVLATLKFRPSAAAGA
jgi:hypothetical protein